MATKKQAKQAPTKSALNKSSKNGKQFPSNGFEARERARKSAAARQGWATRRANATAANKAYFHVRPATASNQVITSASSIVDPRPAEGTITELARQNESTSLRLGANIGSLLNRLRVKLYGSEIPVDPSKPSAHSESIIISAQQRTQENLEAALKMIEELDQLQEVNL